jgi:hypothetical protein
MEPGLIWILGGLLLLAAELVLPGVFLFWSGLAAIGTGLAMLLVVLPSTGVATLFLLLLAGGVALALWLRRRDPPAAVNRPEAGLVGRHGTLLPGGPGGLRVRIGDSDWPARLPKDMQVPESAIAVRVEGVQGTTLIVRPDAR